MHKRQRPLALLLILLVLFISACGNTASSGSNAPSSFTLVYQPGLGAVIFVILKEQKILDKQFPNTQFQWKIVNSGSAVREAIIANQGQLGILGLPPFLVGWDRGMDWKVLLATSRADSWLVAKNPRFKTLKDFGPNDKIGVVAPDAQQAIVLRKAALQQLGNAHALDRNLVAIGSADGEQALQTGQIAAQLSGSPFPGTRNCCWRPYSPPYERCLWPCRCRFNRRSTKLLQPVSGLWQSYLSGLRKRDILRRCAPR